MVEVTGHGSRVTGHGSRVKVKVIFGRAAVDIRSSALPSAVKGNKSHYESKVFVCVSIISGRMRIIAQMRSNFFEYCKEKYVRAKNCFAYLCFFFIDKLSILEPPIRIE